MGGNAPMEVTKHRLICEAQQRWAATAIARVVRARREVAARQRAIAALQAAARGRLTRVSKGSAQQTGEDKELATGVATVEARRTLTPCRAHAPHP